MSKVFEYMGCITFISLKVLWGVARSLVTRSDFLSKAVLSRFFGWVSHPYREVLKNAPMDVLGCPMGLKVRRGLVGCCYREGVARSLFEGVSAVFFELSTAPSW